MTSAERAGSSILAAAIPAAVLICFFVLPFSIMVAVSFFERVQGAFFEPAFVLSNYERFLSPFFGSVLATSLLLAAGASVVSVAVAYPFAWMLVQFRRRGQTLILVFVLAVLSLSEVIIGFAWSSLLSRTAGIGNLLAFAGLVDAPRSYTPGLAALMLGLCYLGLPYAVLVIYPALSRLDPAIPEAARMLGASPLRAFLGTVVPLSRNTISGALILVFVFSLGAYLLPQLLGRPQHWTLSVHITDQAIFQSNLPFAAAMAVLFLMISLLLVGVSMLLGRQRS